METPGPEMRLYAAAMHRHPLLDRDGELALGAEIEARSRALWVTLLADRATVARLAAERLPAAAAALRRVGRSIRAVAARMHALDVDHLLADEVVASITGGARPSRHAAAVAAAARAVADARGRFVTANIGLVLHVAARYRTTALSYPDLVQEGMVGLLKAVDRFDHRRGLRFSTYATWWIRHAIGRARADKSRLVRIPVHVLEDGARLAAADRALRGQLARAPSRDELAQAAGMPLRKVDRVELATRFREIALDAPVGDDDDQARAEVFVAPTGAPDIDGVLDQLVLVAAARKHSVALSAIEREVLRRRFGLDGADREETLREIAVDHGLSRERVRQIQVLALRKLRGQLARLDA